MSNHLHNAADSVQLARLLQKRVGLRDSESAKEQYRTQLELAKAEINIALDELEAMEELQQ
jgi:hypothetical protein